MKPKLCPVARKGALATSATASTNAKTVEVMGSHNDHVFALGVLVSGLHNCRDMFVML